MSRTLLWLAVALPVWAAPPAPRLPAWARPLEPARAQPLEAVFRALTAGQKTAVVAGVLLDDQVWYGASGSANLEKRVPASPRTSFRMASITKTFTAVSVLQLVEEGKVSLDAEIQTYVPDFPRKSWPITVRQLLSHLGGISHYRGLPGEDRITRHLDTAQSLALFRDWELVAEPGTRFHYSSYGFNLLGAAIEGASGERYADYLQRHLFGPLGMSQSDVERPERRTPLWAQGYTLRRGFRERSVPIDISSRFAGGGTRSTVVDLLRYARGLFDGELVEPRSWRAMQTIQTTRDGVPTDYGLGFGAFPQRGRYVVTHQGGQPETSTLLLLVPSERFAIALASNLEDNGALLSELATAAQELLLEGGVRRRTAYAPDPADALFLEGLSRLHSYGLALNEFHRGYGVPEEPPDGSALGPGEAPFEKASALLSAAGLAAPDARERLQAGHFPRDGAPLARAGEEMAARVEEVFGLERLARARALGPLELVADYALACEQTRCPARARLSDEVMERVQRLLPAWEQANPPEVQQLRVDAKTDPSALEALLRRTTEGAAARPDLAPELCRVGLELAAAGKKPEGLALIELANVFYPQSPEARLARVDFFLLVEDLASARTSLSEAAQQPRLGLSAAVLQKRADQLRRYGRAPAAAQLMRLSSELALRPVP